MVEKITSLNMFDTITENIKHRSEFSYFLLREITIHHTGKSSMVKVEESYIMPIMLFNTSIMGARDIHFAHS